MREILFRGQTRRYGEKVRMGDGAKVPSNWVYGGVLQGIGAHSIIYGGGNENDPSEGLNKRVVYTDTLGQFTGLTDRNNKRIFEGDLVKEQDVVHNGEIQIHGHIFSVVMRKGCWCVIPIYDTEEWDFLNSYLPFLEVIGNIHDNPELLGGANHEHP